ncbi:MAG: 16S rRNA (cytosine(967)-C(5))-methyltransferase RsmB [Thermodesulfobacteriota bacterium]
MPAIMTPSLRKRSNRQLPADPRRLAMMVLNIIEKEKRPLDGILEDLYSRSALSNPDQKLFHALVYGVLRHRGFLDHVIRSFSKIAVNKITPEILNILRIGLYQTIYMNKIPVSAAVNTSVEMAKSMAPPWIIGYVNAILRKAVQGWNAVPLPEPKDLIPYLSITESFPEWLIARWVKEMGADETEKLCKSINTIPAIVVRTNTLKTDVDSLEKALLQFAEQVRPCEWSSIGIRFFNPRRPIDRIPFFIDGWFQVQDEAAQLVTELLNPKPGERILDACAGQGGKTGHIAQNMKNLGSITAVDTSTERLSQLTGEMTRLGVHNVKTIPADLEIPMGSEFREAFDRILLDAPCSGLGVLRRNPEAKWRIRQSDLMRNQARQLRMLDNLCHCVKPSGVLVYAVCSREPEENEEVVNHFLARHDNFAIRRNHPEFSGRKGILISSKGYLNTSPSLHGMDGFFGVCFERMT